jgi:hypothetical protein
MGVQVPTYIQYIMVNGVLVKGIAFLRLPGAAIFFILSKLSGTKRQKKRLWSQQYMQVRHFYTLYHLTGRPSTLCVHLHSDSSRPPVLPVRSLSKGWPVAGLQRVVPTPWGNMPSATTVQIALHLSSAELLLPKGL